MSLAATSASEDPATFFGTAPGTHSRPPRCPMTTSTLTADPLPPRPIPGTKQEPAHSTAKRVRGPNIYSQLLPVALDQPPSFIAKLIPALKPSRPAPFAVCSSQYEPISNSVWVTTGGMTLWQRGFFGKGSLSRSEPTWLQRAKNRKMLEVLQDDQGLKLTAEELTAKRRVERKETKIQKSKLKQQPASELPSIPDSEASQKSRRDLAKPKAEIPEDLELELQAIEDMEHLQLMSEEAFFLTFGLGCLDVTLEDKDSAGPLTIMELWHLFCQASIKGNEDQTIRSDNPFILSYVVYHHFRSLGWVVRSGIKFCADWVLYGSRGPVGGHAEFAVCMVPVYEDGTPLVISEDRTSWRWLSTVNRVCSGVKKTLILVHVIVPTHLEIGDLDSPNVLSRYVIKEIAIKRFIPARMRD